MYYFGNTFKCKPEYGDCSPGSEYSVSIKMVRDLMIPFFITTLIPNLTSLMSRFIIQSLVEEKQNKMKETLSLMSLSSFSYAISYIIF